MAVPSMQVLKLTKELSERVMSTYSNAQYKGSITSLPITDDGETFTASFRVPNVQVARGMRRRIDLYQLDAIMHGNADFARLRTRFGVGDACLEIPEMIVTCVCGQPTNKAGDVVLANSKISAALKLKQTLRINRVYAVDKIINSRDRFRIQTVLALLLESVRDRQGSGAKDQENIDVRYPPRGVSAKYCYIWLMNVQTVWMTTLLHVRKCPYVCEVFVEHTERGRPRIKVQILRHGETVAETMTALENTEPKLDKKAQQQLQGVQG